MTEDLDGLNVIITRPLQQSRELALKIEEQKGFPVLFPTLEILPASKNLIMASLQTIKDDDLVIFSSQNAVQCAAPFLPTTAHYKVAAIGPSTAAALRQIGIKTDLTPTECFDSENLLALTYFQDIKDKKVAIIGGEGGRVWLEEALRSRGAIVRKIEVYRRICPDINAMQISILTELTPLIFISTSGESLQNLFTIMRKRGVERWLVDQVILVVSDRIGQIAFSLGFKKNSVIISDNATSTAILDRLIKWYAKHY